MAFFKIGYFVVLAVASYTDDTEAAAGGLPAGLRPLEQYLGSHRKVIVSVNAETIRGTRARIRARPTTWFSSPRSNTDTDNVYLNDSGGEDTRDEQVNIETFETAWKTGGHDMAVTSAPAS